MQVIYRAFNGLDFETEKECLEYENEHSGFRMYSPTGLTDNFDWAKAVVFLNAQGVENFIKGCKACDSPYDGLTDEFEPCFNAHPRVFLWDYGLMEYREIEYAMWKILSEIFSTCQEG